MIRTLTSWFAVACLACGADPRVAGAAAEDRPAVDAAPVLSVEPYRFTANDGTVVDAELGRFDVPERRADPRARRISLSFVRFRATAAAPGDPIVYLAGGPGGSGIAAAAGRRFPIFQALRRLGDVIAFDQRGTGRSNHLAPCTDPAPPWTTLPVTRDRLVRHFRDRLSACFDQWDAGGSDIDGYTTLESAHDLEDLRRALGARRVNLWGISYGSHLGLAMLKYHERSVGRAVFAGIEALDQTVKRPALTDEMIGRVQALIDRDPAAAALYPDLAGTMRRVHARLETAPVAVAITPPGAAGPVTVTLGGFPLAILAGSLLADPGSTARLPLLYLGLDRGEYAAAATLVYQGLPTRFTGMPEAMDLASGITAQRLAEVTAEARTAVLGDALNFPMPHLRGIRPRLDLGDGFRAAFRAATPVLFISGTLDGRTYPAEAADALRGLRNGRRLVVENGGHNIFEADPRVADAVIAFLDGRPVPDVIHLAPPVFARP